jgi:flagellar biosynthetic protein FliR
VFELPPASVAYGFLLVLMRCAGLCMTAPVLGARVVPARVRLTVAMVLGFTVFMGAGAPPARVPTHILSLFGAAFTETLTGLLAGLFAQWCLDAAMAAGQAAGLAMGLGYGAMLDPINGSESTAISQLLSLTALGIALGLGVHREAVLWLAESVKNMPPGTSVDLLAFAQTTIAHAVGAFALAVRLGFPVVAAATAGHVLMGVLSRAAPQLNMNTLGFSVTLLAGGGALYLVAPTLARVAAQQAVASFSQ